MSPILNLALKDLKLLWRDKLAAFFILGFPILMGLFFGMVFGGGPSGGKKNASKTTLLIVDEDQTTESQNLISKLESNNNLTIKTSQRENAVNQVRLGKAPAYLLIPKGYGENAGVFWQNQTPLDLGTDPSRSAETAMLEGFLMQAGGELMMEQFTDFDRTRSMIETSRQQAMQSDELTLVQKGLLTSMFGSFEQFVGSLDKLQTEGTSEAGTDDFDSGMQMQLLQVNRVPITKSVDGEGQSSNPPSGFAISFPQGMIWGVLACCSGFAISIARERSAGTLLRLQASPLTTTQILLGKAVACFLAVCLVLSMMTALGWVLGMTPGQPVLLVISGLLTGFCFVGIMMTMAVLGKSEEAVGGSGWAINTIMAMLGGGMIPLFVMPSFFRQLSVLSPVSWAIQSLEGSIWRQWTISELMVPWAVLVMVGLTGFAIGSTLLKRSLETA